MKRDRRSKSNNQSFKSKGYTKKIGKRLNNSTVPSTSSSSNSRKHKLENNKSHKWLGRSKKLKTSVREMVESTASNSSFDAPSTSTGT